MSRRDKMNNFSCGEILVHEMDDCFSFDAGDENSRLIFVTLGSHRHAYWDFDSQRDEEVNESNAIDIFSGDCLYWGAHMFVTLDEFEDWINNFKFLLDETPGLVENIRRDSECDVVCDRFDKMRGLQCANAIINHAKLVLRGLETGRFKFPVNIRKAYKIICRETKVNERKVFIDELSTLQDKLYDPEEELSQEAKEELNAKIEDLKEKINDFNIEPSEEEVNALIEEQMVTALKRIASIEPFDCVRTMIEEEQVRHKKYEERQKKLEQNQSSDEEDEESDNGYEDDYPDEPTDSEPADEESDEDSYEPEEEEDVGDHSNDCPMEDLPQSPHGPTYLGPNAAY